MQEAASDLQPACKTRKPERLAEHLTVPPYCSVTCGLWAASAREL